MESPPSNDVCSICRDDFALPCQANCSHWFCGECIMTVWEHESVLRPCKCPICRRPITLLVPSEAAQDQHNDAGAGRVMERVQRYNQLFGRGTQSLTQRVRDLPFFIGRLMRELLNPQRSIPLLLRTRMTISMFLAFVYLVSPVDLLPESALGLVGYIDDLLVLLLVFLHLAALYRSLLLNRHGGD